MKVVPKWISCNYRFHATTGTMNLLSSSMSGFGPYKSPVIKGQAFAVGFSQGINVGIISESIIYD